MVGDIDLNFQKEGFGTPILWDTMLNLSIGLGWLLALTLWYPPHTYTLFDTAMYHRMPASDSVVAATLCCTDLFPVPILTDGAQIAILMVNGRERRQSIVEAVLGQRS